MGGYLPRKKTGCEIIQFHKDQINKQVTNSLKKAFFHCICNVAYVSQWFVYGMTHYISVQLSGGLQCTLWMVSPPPGTPKERHVYFFTSSLQTNTRCLQLIQDSNLHGLLCESILKFWHITETLYSCIHITGVSKVLKSSRHFILLKEKRDPMK